MATTKEPSITDAGARAGTPAIVGGGLSPADLATLVDLTTPRAYYLWSGLPIGIRNSN